MVRWTIWGALAAAFVVAFVRRTLFAGILGVLAGFVAIFVPLSVFNSDAVLGPAVCLAFGSFGAIMVGAMRQNPGSGRSHPGGGGGGSWSSSSDSSSSSSSYSGGGGDSGGGGSSESW
jgi:uncharacterized protein